MPLTRDEIREHIGSYEAQLYRILDPNRTELLFNGDWLGSQTFSDVIKLASEYTVARLLERDDFADRFARHEPIGVHELLYPLCQGYDSVAMRADVELGGSDQRFNILVGRDLQRTHRQEPQVVMLMPILVGTDGVQKMSKSLGNYIGIDEPPSEQFGKIMSIDDAHMDSFFRLCTDVDLSEIDALIGGVDSGEVHPMDAKYWLAREIVTLYHGDDAAAEAEDAFRQVFSERGVPDDVADVSVPAAGLTIVGLVTTVGFASSNRDARQLISEGAVSIDGEPMREPNAEIVPVDGALLRVGKRRFARLRVEA